MAEYIDRRRMKGEVRSLLANAQVSPKAMTALYLGLMLALNFLTTITGDRGIISTFVYILSSLMSLVLHAGFVLYCMAIRRGERAEFLTLFDGFSFAGKQRTVMAKRTAIIAALQKNGAGHFAGEVQQGQFLQSGNLHRDTPLEFV